MSINSLLQDDGQPVVWRGPLIGRAIEQFWRDIAWGKLDYLIIDLPPGTPDTALTVAQQLGHIPLDPELAVQCDDGAIEDYRCAAFDGIVEQILASIPVELSDSALHS
jgi:hypothetical protein